MANEESILGLLLRALTQIAEQKHGERYVHGNDATSMDYEMAQGHVVNAIHAVTIAERTQVRFEAKKLATSKQGISGQLDPEAPISGDAS